MVALSLYRGNLHKVHNKHREWLMPPRKISQKDFRTLIRRRQRSRPNPNPNPNPPQNHQPHDSPNNQPQIQSIPEADTELEVVLLANPAPEIARKEEVVSDKQKRRQEIEEKLKILNAKKHDLVQALKQIITAEEELKRRSNTQSVSGQPPVGGGQVEGTHDSGSMSRDNTPRMGSELNGRGETEGAETDGAKHSVHLHQLVRTSSTSPSSDIQQHKSPFTKATLPSRTNSGMANSPSRFALAGQQGLPPNLPLVSVSGTNYVASSPSPVASGGTSAFRDGRGKSPWN